MLIVLFLFIDLISLNFLLNKLQKALLNVGFCIFWIFLVQKSSCGYDFLENWSIHKKKHLFSKFTPKKSTKRHPSFLFLFLSANLDLLGHFGSKTKTLTIFAVIVFNDLTLFNFIIEYPNAF